MSVKYEKVGDSFFRVIYDAINYKPWMSRLSQDDFLRVVKFKEIKREEISEERYDWGQLGPGDNPLDWEVL